MIKKRQRKAKSWTMYTVRLDDEATKAFEAISRKKPIPKNHVFKEAVMSLHALVFAEDK